ncbi:MAG: hypothetical protein IPJ34_27340 [Myxococcales bacterium]|nr:hypothetical protein [Myxococcales bacterium]
MRRRNFRTVVLLVSALGIGTFASMASGANPAVEKEAKKLQGDAMDVDFLSLDYKAAKKKLDDAIKKCGADNCSPAVAAGLHRDLGVVLINDKKVKDGQKEFDAAFAADATISISNDYLANKDVKSAWEASKKNAGSATPPVTTTAPSGTGTGKPPTTAPDAEGNLTVKTKLAPTGYPLPVLVDLPEGLDVDNVKLSYKTAAMEKYKTVDVKKDSGKYVATIPCEDTQFVGDIKFYVRAYDSDKNEIEHFGTLKKPGILKLVEKMPDDVEAPAYPGGKEPQKCVDKGNCQPGFPCDADANKKPQGSAATATTSASRASRASTTRTARSGATRRRARAAAARRPAAAPSCGSAPTSSSTPSSSSVTRTSASRTPGPAAPGVPMSVFLMRRASRPGKEAESLRLVEATPALASVSAPCACSSASTISSRRASRSAVASGMPSTATRPPPPSSCRSTPRCGRSTS